eukprot:11166949-Ditylum_brightwellii.AAC.1
MNGNKGFAKDNDDRMQLIKKERNMSGLGHRGELCSQVASGKHCFDPFSEGCPDCSNWSIIIWTIKLLKEEL